MKEKPQIGMINEVGDLGLGFTVISEEDKKKIKNKEENKED